MDSAGIDNFKVTRVWKASVLSEGIEAVKHGAELTVARETGVARFVTMTGRGGEESRSDVFRVGETEYRDKFAGLWMCSGTTDVDSFVSQWMMGVRWLVNHAPDAVETLVDGKPVFHLQLDTASIDRVFEESGMNLVSPREEFRTINLDLYLSRDTSIPLGYRSSRTAMVDSRIVEHSVSVQMSDVNELARIERPPGLICWPGLAIETHDGSYYLANVEHSPKAVVDLAKVGLEAHGFTAGGAKERDGVEVYTYEKESARLELAVSVWSEAGVKLPDFKVRAEALFARAVPKPMPDIDRDGPGGKRKGSTALYRGETVEGSVIVMKWTPRTGSRAGSGR